MTVNEADASGASGLAGAGSPSTLAVELRARLDALLQGPWQFRDLDQMTALYEQLAALTADVTHEQMAARALLTSLNGLQFDVSTRAEATRLLVRQLGDASPAGWEIANLTRLLGEGGPQIS